MYIESVKNRRSPPCILLRESVREGRSTRKRTIANLTDWPPKLLAGLKALLRTGGAGSGVADFEVVRSLPYGHVAAVLGVIRKLGLDRMLAAKPGRDRDLALALIVARVIDPVSKLATAQGLQEETAFSALGEVLGLKKVTEDDLYAAMDWLGERQLQVEQKLAVRHLKLGAPVFCDLTSVWMEGRHCPLAKFGHSRDGKSGKLQIEFSLLCDQAGRPVAVEVFEGNTADPATVATLIEKMRRDFSLERFIFVGDRGTLTNARLKNDLDPSIGLDWISALRAPAIKKLAAAGCIQPSLFDHVDLAEIESPDFPGERLIACFNPFLADERRRKREDLLEMAERKLEKISAAAGRSKAPLRGKDRIGVAVTKFQAGSCVAKHFIIEFDDVSVQFRRDQAKIDAEAALDGIYVVRTSLPAAKLAAPAVVGAYKNLSKVERAFRTIKTIDLKVRPIHHRLEERVRAHVFLCMLAYYVEWHMRELLAPVLFDDDAPAEAAAARPSIVAPACRSAKAEAKASSRVTEDDQPVHNFRSLLKDIATIAINKIRPKIKGAKTFNQITLPTPFQQRIITLLGISI